MADHDYYFNEDRHRPPMNRDLRCPPDHAFQADGTLWLVAPTITLRRRHSELPNWPGEVLDIWIEEIDGDGTNPIRHYLWVKDDVFTAKQVHEKLRHIWNMLLLGAE